MERNNRTVSSYIQEIKKMFPEDHETAWLDETNLNKLRSILQEIDDNFGDVKKYRDI